LAAYVKRDVNSRFDDKEEMQRAVDRMRRSHNQMVMEIQRQLQAIKEGNPLPESFAGREGIGRIAEIKYTSLAGGGDLPQRTPERVGYPPVSRPRSGRRRSRDEQRSPSPYYRREEERREERREEGNVRLVMVSPERDERTAAAQRQRDVMERGSRDVSPERNAHRLRLQYESEEVFVDRTATPPKEKESKDFISHLLDGAVENVLDKEFGQGKA